ncbi:MAG: flagellar hook-length control protein FliK, partial [Betaproteobacteria bacterium]
AQSVSNRIHALLRSGGWHLNLRLDPANLGEINIELEMTDSGLEGRIGASDETTRQLLQDSVHRLRASMKEIVEPGQFLNLSVHKDAKNDSSRDNDRRKGSEKSEELDILAQVITQPEQRQLMRSGILDILV